MSGRLELARRAHHAHALAAAAGRRLDQDRVADPLGLLEGVEVVAEHPVRARDRGQALGAEQAPGGLLAGEPLEDLGRRPDERQAVGTDDLGEALVLGQEAVARVDRVAAGDDRGADHRRRREVAPLGIGRPDADRLVGQLDGQAVAIGLAVGDDRLDAERPAGPQDPDGDLAAVGDQDLGEHQASRPGRSAGVEISSIQTSSWPYSTASPFSTSAAPTIPLTGATTSWGMPRTSTLPIRSPARTREPELISGRGW